MKNAPSTTTFDLTPFCDPYSQQAMSRAEIQKSFHICVNMYTGFISFLFILKGFFSACATKISGHQNSFFKNMLKGREILNSIYTSKAASRICNSGKITKSWFYMFFVVFFTYFIMNLEQVASFFSIQFHSLYDGIAVSMYFIYLFIFAYSQIFFKMY